MLEGGEKKKKEKNTLKKITIPPQLLFPEENPSRKVLSGPMGAIGGAAAPQMCAAAASRGGGQPACGCRINCAAAHNTLYLSAAPGSLFVIIHRAPTHLISYTITPGAWKKKKCALKSLFLKNQLSSLL